MNTDLWYLDFEEKSQIWHMDNERVPENEYWTNIGYGPYIILNHFCDFVNMMGRELGITFTTAQIIRLAECTPGITVHQATPIPEEQFDIDVHMAPIHSKEAIERQIGLKPMEE